MITMVEKNRILIDYYRQDKSITSISRNLKISRKTVRKYISEHERLCGKSQAKDELEKGLSIKPHYDSSNRKKRKFNTEIKDIIKYCLSENKKKRNSGQHKQQMKKIDIYEYLKLKSYNIGYTTVCNYINELEQTKKESFIKQKYSPGSISEFDWGDVKLYINNKLQIFNLAVFTSAYSNHRWAKLFYKQDTLAFCQSHIDYFSCIQGTHSEIVYDNMRVAVRKFVGYNIKEPTIALLELSNYYKFNFRFCNVRRGNEKGHVERSVEYIRRKSFSSRDNFVNILEANEHLLNSLKRINNSKQQLSNNTANNLFEAEKPYLYQSNIPYKYFVEDHSKVDKYSTIILFGNRYSVPDFLVGKLLDVRIFAEKIDVYFNREFLCSHTRSHGLHTWTLDLNHYLTTLSRKPGALKNSVVLSLADEKIRNIYSHYFIENSKGFIELLQHCRDKEIDFETVDKAVEKLKKISPTDINKDKILIIIDKMKETKTEQNTNNETYKQSINTLKELASVFNL